MSQFPSRAEIDAAIRSHAIRQGQDQMAVTRVGIMLDALYNQRDHFNSWLANALSEATAATHVLAAVELGVLNRVREAWGRTGTAPDDHREGSQ